MVNAALNWASIVGIVLAVGGAVLYFVRNFKPALARDYDVFFAAVGLLCGGILFFQGWRLDPILQFGQFLLAGSTVFFAYESVRLRGVTTEQARRSAYFEDEEAPPFRPRGGLGGAPDWERERDRFDQSEPIRRRIRSREDEEEDFYRPRRASRAAIPERAASRGVDPEAWDRPRRDLPAEDGPGAPRSRSSAPWSQDSSGGDTPPPGSRYSAGGGRPGSTPFGARRRDREEGTEVRRGSRPVPSSGTMPRSSRRPSETGDASPYGAAGPRGESTAGIPQGTPLRRGEARPASSAVRDADFSPIDSPSSRPRGADSAGTFPEAPSPTRGGAAAPGRDNSSRFDD